MNINRKLTRYNFTDKNDTSRIKYIVIHYVGALGGAEANCNYYDSGYLGASAHYFVGFSGEIWQCVDDADIAWHCGATSYKHPECRNSNSIGIELCVRKVNTKSLGATDKDWYFEDATVNSAVELTKYLMKKYNVPVDHVIRHYDVTGKICPNPYVYNTQKHVWDEFKKLIGSGGSSTVDTDKFYRVRKQWTGVANLKADGQLGAYSSLENAKANCPVGYKVYDWNGNVKYDNSSKPVGTQGSDFAGLSDEEAIKKVGALYTADQKRTGILACVSLAQGILECGYFKNTILITDGNNAHGMKCNLSGNTWAGSTWDGVSKITKVTQEQDADGNVRYETADFRKYECLEDSIADHSAYLLNAMNGSKKRYDGLVGETDYRKAITIIKNGGYATDVSYIDKICSIIEKWNLTKYNYTGATSSTPVSPSKPSSTTPTVKKTETVSGTVTVIYHGTDGLEVHNTPDFNDSSCNHKHGPVGPKYNGGKNGSVFTAVAKVTLSDGSSMYKLKSGLYITASTKYVKFTATKKKLTYTTGDYVTNDVMNIRSGPGTEYSIKKWSDMTSGSKATNPKTSTGKAYYKKGIIFTALEVFNYENEAWARTPSGYICLEMNGEKFCKKK